MKPDNETIIRFKNGRILHLPYEAYDKIAFYGEGVTEIRWNTGNSQTEIQLKQEDVLYIARTTQNTLDSKNYTTGEIIKENREEKTMIKFENGLFKISGKGIDILSEYAVITHEIKEMFVKDGGEEKDVKEQLRHSFEHGLMNEEEFDKEIKEKFKQVDAIIPIVSLLEEMLKTFGAKDKED